MDVHFQAVPVEDQRIDQHLLVDDPDKVALLLLVLELVENDVAQLQLALAYSLHVYPELEVLAYAQVSDNLEEQQVRFVPLLVLCAPLNRIHAQLHGPLVVPVGELNAEVGFHLELIRRPSHKKVVTTHSLQN